MTAGATRPAPNRANPPKGLQEYQVGILASSCELITSMANAVTPTPRRIHDYDKEGCMMCPWGVLYEALLSGCCRRRDEAPWRIVFSLKPRL